jgi:DNA-binding GntR family transcriptional regulator
MDTLLPISMTTLSETVTERIRVAIIKGELKPGEKLAEPVLASRLGVSRSPVREALVRLESEGLVEKESNHGFYVWEPTQKDVDEILSVRVMVETFAAELILDRMTDEHLEHLESIYKIQAKAVEKNDHLALTREDRQFHDYLIELTGNTRLIEGWKRLMGQWELLVYRRMEADLSVSGTVLVDHRNFIDAIRKKDFASLVALHRQINDRVCREMKAALWNQTKTAANSSK